MIYTIHTAGGGGGSGGGLVNDYDAIEGLF